MKQWMPVRLKRSDLLSERGPIMTSVHVGRQVACKSGANACACTRVDLLLRSEQTNVTVCRHKLGVAITVAKWKSWGAAE